MRHTRPSAVPFISRQRSRRTVYGLSRPTRQSGVPSQGRSVISGDHKLGTDRARCRPITSHSHSLFVVILSSAGPFFIVIRTLGLPEPELYPRPLTFRRSRACPFQSAGRVPVGLSERRGPAERHRPAERRTLPLHRVIYVGEAGRVEPDGRRDDIDTPVRVFVMNQRWSREWDRPRPSGGWRVLSGNHAEEGGRRPNTDLISSHYRSPARQVELQKLGNSNTNSNRISGRLLEPELVGISSGELATAECDLAGLAWI